MILQALELMWKGMLSIFIAISVVFLLVLALNYLTNIKKAEGSKKLLLSKKKENTEESN